MKDFQLYQQILGLVAPWQVESVTLKPRLFRDLLVVIDWLETHIVLAESPGRLWPKAIRTSWARLFAWAGRVRYAWRPAATRTMVRETVAAARQPTRIDGAIPSFC